MADGKQIAKGQESREIYLILTAGALAEVLALNARHVAPFRIWVKDLKKIGMGMKSGMSVNARTYALAGKGERSDDDPFPVFMCCNGQ